MSSLFDHNRDSVISPFNKVYKIRNKNREGHKNILLNVKSIRSPDTRSSSIRKKSTSKLFKQAHRISSEATQETSHGQKSQNDFFCPTSPESQKLSTTSKTRRTNTLEEKKKKITLKKKLSEGNHIEKTVEVCVDGEAVLHANEADLVDSLTKLILEDDPQKANGQNTDLDTFLGQSTITQNSFELQIDSNLVTSNPELLEWSELIKRI